MGRSLIKGLYIERKSLFAATHWSLHIGDYVKQREGSPSVLCSGNSNLGIVHHPFKRYVIETHLKVHYTWCSDLYLVEFDHILLVLNLTTTTTKKWDNVQSNDIQPLQRLLLPRHLNQECCLCGVPLKQHMARVGGTWLSRSRERLNTKS